MSRLRRGLVGGAVLALVPALGGPAAASNGHGDPSAWRGGTNASTSKSSAPVHLVTGVAQSRVQSAYTSTHGHQYGGTLAQIPCMEGCTSTSTAKPVSVPAATSDGGSLSDQQVYTVMTTPTVTAGGAAPPPPPPPPPNPLDLARQAAAQIAYPTPTVHTAPTSPGPTWINLETWLWTQQAAFRSLHASVTVRNTTVTVNAHANRIAWDTGNGDGTSCAGPGEVWRKGMTDSATTYCSYTYRNRSDLGRRTVTASTVYFLDWRCSGQCIIGSGALGEHSGPQGSAPLRVRERETVVTGGH